MDINSIEKIQRNEIMNCPGNSLLINYSIMNYITGEDILFFKGLNIENIRYYNNWNDDFIFNARGFFIQSGYNHDIKIKSICIRIMKIHKRLDKLTINIMALIHNENINNG